MGSDIEFVYHFFGFASSSSFTNSCGFPLTGTSGQSEVIHFPAFYLCQFLIHFDSARTLSGGWIQDISTSRWEKRELDVI
jgi:hypothetical protein